MADMMDSQLTVLPKQLTGAARRVAGRRDRDERFVLAVDLGTGGPKVGLVSLTGPGRVARPLPGRDALAARRRRGAGRRRVVGPDRRRDPARASPSGVVAPEPDRGGELHRAVGEHGAGRRGRASRSATASSGWTAAARRTPGSVIGGPVSGLRAGAARDLGPAHRRRAVARPAPTRSATCSTSRTTSPTSRAPRAGILEPVDYLSMRFTGERGRVARVDDRRVAHRQPPPRPARLRRRRCVRAGRRRRRASCRRCGRPARSSAPCADDVADELGLPDGVQVVTGTPDLHSGAVGAGTVLRLRDAPGDQHVVVDQLPGAVQEDRRLPPDRDGPRA